MTADEQPPHGLGHPVDTTQPTADAAKHRVWRLPADIDTDVLAPGGAMKFGIAVIAQHCLQAVRPGLVQQLQPGDVLVAGANFGIGSSREQAAEVLVHLGVAAVIAPSFSGLYQRNAFNLGLLLLTCADAGQLAEGERITLDAAAGRITRVDGQEPGQTLTCAPIPGFLLELVRCGGLFKQLQQRLGTSTPSALTTPATAPSALTTPATPPSTASPPTPPTPEPP